ncbi:MAG: Ig-like domain-containing protein [Thermoplasmatota archaeon]
MTEEIRGSSGLAARSNDAMGPGTRPRKAATLLFTGLLLTGGLLLAGPGARGALVLGWTAETPGLLPNMQTALLLGISCWSSGNCTAAGFEQNNTLRLAMVEEERNAVWATPYTLPPPPTINNVAPSPHFYAISCVSAGNCTAVGGAAEEFGQGQSADGGFAMTETNGTWGAFVYLAPAYVQFWGISCTAPADCVAVGYAETSPVTPRLATETNGVWAVVTPSLPSNAWVGANGPESFLQGVSCTSTGNCTAIGSYYTGTTTLTQEGMSMTETNGTWAGAVELPVAPNGANVAFQAIDCPTANVCVAVGGPFAAVETDGVWASLVSLNSLAPGDIVGVGCATPSYCRAMDFNGPTSGTTALAYNNGTWTTEGGILLGGSPYAALSSMSCAPACEAVGVMPIGSDNYEPVTAREGLVRVQDPTSTSLTYAPATLYYGSNVTLTATVVDTVRNSTPTGFVQFLDDGANLGVAPLAANGQASLSISNLSVNWNDVQARYLGTMDFMPSTRAVSIPVEAAPTHIVAHTLGVSRFATTAGGGPRPTAQLVSNVTGAGISNQTIVFSTGSGPTRTTLCAALTDASGTATCAGPATSWPAVLASSGYTAAFGGSDDYVSSTASAGLGP